MRIFVARASKPGIMVGDLLQADRVLEVPAKGNAGFGCKIHENGIKIDPSYELAAAKVK